MGLEQTWRETLRVVPQGSRLCVLWSCPHFLLSRIFHIEVEREPLGEAQHNISFEGSQQLHFAGSLWALDLDGEERV